MDSLEEVISYIANTATVSDLGEISDAMESRCLEEGSRCALHAALGLYVSVWNADPGYLDNLRGTIIDISEDCVATVRLDASSATMLRLNIEAHDDGYVTTFGADEALHVRIPTACCRAVDGTPVDEQTLRAFLRELAAL